MVRRSLERFSGVLSPFTLRENILSLGVLAFFVVGTMVRRFESV